mgnify:CR=1 FL=1|tara:strand:- start:8320 stop:8625 length:306 start_codon:yes stop_codon:yes gene_type:complete
MMAIIQAGWQHSPDWPDTFTGFRIKYCRDGVYYYAYMDLEDHHKHYRTLNSAMAVFNNHRDTSGFYITEDMVINYIVNSDCKNIWKMSGRYGVPRLVDMPF